MAWFDQKALRAEMVRAAEYIRGELTRHGCEENFTLSIEVKGSADKADARLKFSFDTSRNYGTGVNSPNLADAVSELLRRRGFDKLHEAELLTYDPLRAAEIERAQQPVAAPPQPQDD
jgi:hypothetical protein